MEPENYVPKVNRRNQMFAQKIKELADKYSILGVVDVHGLPALQFQRIRASLKGKAEVLIVKKNLIELVFDELEKTHSGISELKGKLNGIVGLVFTNDNPFVLYKMVQKSKSSAPAKKGSIAPKDIVVPAGPTGFAPGPIIGELGSFKIKAGINAGKVEIKEDAVVAKEGEDISGKLAEILTRLAIEPMEVGLNIKAVYEDGLIFTRDVLDVDVDEVLNNLKVASSDSFKLSVGLDYFTKDNMSYFLGEATKDSLGLGVGLSYPAKETLSRLVGKANSQMVGLANVLPDEVRPAGLAVAQSAVPVVEESNSTANEEPKKEESSQEDPAEGFGSFF
jgi:large subunit ribosomal protein L10